LAGALGSGSARAQDLPAADTVIDAVLAAYGGASRLAEVEGFRIEGQLVTHRHPTPVRTVRIFSRPDRLRVELHYPNIPETRWLDGDRGWRNQGAGAQPVSGMLLSAMHLQAARTDLPWLLAAHRDDVRVIGPVQREDRTLIGLEMLLGSSLLVRAYVDPHTYYVVETLGLLVTRGRGVSFETFYADFRMVDGIVFAFAEENRVSGTHTGSTRITRIDLNPALNPGTFRPDP
jgi:hypothetical protein